MKRKKIIIAIVCFALIASVGIVFAVAYTAATPSTEIERISKKSVLSIISEVNKLDESAVESGEASIYAQVMLEKVRDLGNSRIEKMIKNPKNSTLLKVILLQTAKDLDIELDYRDMAYLVTDESTDFDVKQNIIMNVSALKKDPELLEEFYNGTDDDVAFQALKALFLSGSERYYELAQEIIAQRETISEKRLKIACLKWDRGFTVMKNRN